MSTSPFALQLITSAMQEINILGTGETPEADEANWGLEKLQRLIDRLNAYRQAIYALNFTVFNLIANHAPHTIGPSGADFTFTPRPVRIVSGAFILNAGSSNQQVDDPINIRDQQWWAAQPVKTQTSSIVTDLYYSPDVPNGTINFWPICTIANPVRLEMWTSLVVPLTTETQLVLPTGYWDAIVLSLGADLCSAFDAPATVKSDVQERARRAMNIIMGNNAKAPRIRTDNSMPNSGGVGRPDFDFLTGLNDN